MKSIKTQSISLARADVEGKSASGGVVQLLYWRDYSCSHANAARGRAACRGCRPACAAGPPGARPRAAPPGRRGRSGRQSPPPAALREADDGTRVGALPCPRTGPVAPVRSLGRRWRSAPNMRQRAALQQPIIRNHEKSAQVPWQSRRSRPGAGVGGAGAGIGPGAVKPPRATQDRAGDYFPKTLQEADSQDVSTRAMATIRAKTSHRSAKACHCVLI